VKEKDRRDESEINKKPRQGQNGNMAAALIKAERQKSVTGTYNDSGKSDSTCFAVQGLSGSVQNVRA